MGLGLLQNSGEVFFFRHLLEIIFVYSLCSYPSPRRKVIIRAKTKQYRKQDPGTAAQRFSSIQSGVQRHPISNPNPGAYIFLAPPKRDLIEVYLMSPSRNTPFIWLVPPFLAGACTWQDCLYHNYVKLGEGLALGLGGCHMGTVWLSGWALTDGNNSDGLVAKKRQ